MKKIMDKGIIHNNASYLTIEDNARKMNDKKNNFLLFSNENIIMNIIKKINNGSVTPRIEFSINLWLKPNKLAPINENFGETNFLQRKYTGIILKDENRILVILWALINVNMSDWPIIEKIGDKNRGQPSFVFRIPDGNWCVLDVSNANEK